MTIAPQATVALTNGEAAAPGQAAVTVNLRERELALQAVGTPVQVASLQAGDRLLAVDGDRYVALRGTDIVLGDVVLASAGSKVLGARVVGNFVVVDCELERLWLHRTGTGYERLNPVDAVPLLHLAAVEVTTVPAQVPACTFGEPKSQWSYPLAQTDIDTLTAQVADACATAAKTMDVQALIGGPVLARYGVRLWDDSYLWLSAPVLVGSEMLTSTLRGRATAVTESGKYVGTTACTLQLPACRVGVSVARGVPQEWQPLVKAVDVLITDPVATFNGSTLDYRVGTSTTSGTRVSSLEMGPLPLASATVAASLLRGKWHVAASTAHIGALSQGIFDAAEVSVNATQVLPGITAYALRGTGARQAVDAAALTAAQLASARQHVPACSLELGGRLYSGGGRVRLTDPWSALPLMAGTITATGCTVRSLTTVATAEGSVTVERTESLPFTPTAVNALVASPHTGAVSHRIEITSAGTTRVIDVPLSLCASQGIAASLEASLQSRALTEGGAAASVDGNALVSAPNLVTISQVANPLAMQWSFLVASGQVLALAAAGRPIYNGGFGRYPLYAFTSAGVYALPQSNTGTYGEARLLSRKVIDPSVLPADGDGSVWFVTALGQLCRATGPRVEAVLRMSGVKELAWNDVERELAILLTDGSMQLLEPSGRSVQLTLQPSQLWADGVHALAVMPIGAVLNLRQEQDTGSSVEMHWLSHPMQLSAAMTAAPTRVQWNLQGSDLDVRLAVRGERGSSCHGFIVSRVHVQGFLGAPVAVRMVPQPLRSLCFEVQGTVPAGTLLLPTNLTLTN